MLIYYRQEFFQQESYLQWNDEPALMDVIKVRGQHRKVAHKFCQANTFLGVGRHKGQFFFLWVMKAETQNEPKPLLTLKTTQTLPL